MPVVHIKRFGTDTYGITILFYRNNCAIDMTLSWAEFAKLTGFTPPAEDLFNSLQESTQLDILTRLCEK